MKKRSSMFIRVTAALMALLLALLSLPVVPVQAEPEETIEDHDDISVLSITVNVNTETGLVFTELILKNTDAEDKEIEVTLPEVYAGIDRSALSVKTGRGEEIEAPDGVVSLNIKADGYAGVSYMYKTRKNLSYEKVIGFDLAQLAEQFNDRIGHLEWTVDMQTYELVLVDAIHPVNYTVADNRISIVLDNFLVSSLLDRVYVKRTTHQDLLNYLGEYAEYIEKSQESYAERYVFLSEEELAQTIKIDSRYIWIRQFFLQHYREWFLDPDYKDSAEYYQKKYNGYTFINGDSWGLAYSVRTEDDQLPGTYYKYIQPVDGAQVSDRGYMLYWNLDRLLHYLTRNDKEYENENRFTDFHSPAINAQLYPGEPSVFAVLLSEQPEIAGKTVLAFEGENGGVVMPGGPNPEDPSYEEWSWSHMYDEFFRFTFADRAQWLYALAPYSDASWHEQEGALERSSQHYRSVCLLESDMEDPEAVQDYLDALGVRAVFRSKYLLKESAEAKEFGSAAGTSICSFPEECSRLLLTFGNSDEYPFDKFVQTFENSAYTLYGSTALIYREDPLDNVLQIPVITQYVGCLLPSKDVLSVLNTDRNKGSTVGASFPVESLEDVLVACNSRYPALPFSDSINEMDSVIEAISSRNRLAREKALREEIEKNINFLREAREALNLPTMEEMKAPFIVEERPTKEPTEESTEESTEASTEATTEATTEASTEALTEATAEVSTEASTAAISSETETFASKDTQDPADKGPLVLLIAIVAGVVVVGAATTAVVIKKKGGNKTSKN